MSDDYFAAEFSGKITPEYDCYIGILADDCARIFINGKQWVGWKSGQLAQNFNTSEPLKAGVAYDIVIECYEHTGKAAAYLMCEPVLPENTSARSVFIPDGTWINAFTGEEFTGPKTVTVTGSISEMPIFIRKGSIIPVSEVVSPMTGADWQELSFNIYGLGDTEASICEDDGETEEYIDGKYRKTDISVKSLEDNTWQINIGKADGDFSTDYTSRNVKLRIHSDTPIGAVTVNGVNAKITALQADSTALPFANDGASNISNIYEITVNAPLYEETTVLINGTLPGDANGDGKITVYDALNVLKAIVNSHDFPAGDINSDKTLSLLDVIIILKECAD